MRAAPLLPACVVSRSGVHAVISCMPTASEVKEMDAQTAYTTVLPSHPIPELGCSNHLFIYYVCVCGRL